MDVKPVYPDDIKVSDNGSLEVEDAKDMTIDDFLSWDGNLKVQKDIYVKKGDLNIKITVRGITQDELDKIQKDSTYTTGTGANKNSEVESRIMNLRTIYKGVVYPDLDDKRLQSRFNPGDRNNMLIINSMFSPGEQGIIVQAILECSGYTDDQINTQFSDLVNLPQEE